MEQITKFNPSEDIQEVEQFGFVDLNSAFVSGTIPSNVTSDASKYNNIEDPSSIAGKPSDTFEALEATKGLKKVVDNERSTAKADAGN